jgi:putative flippase GtrA
MTLRLVREAFAYVSVAVLSAASDWGVFTALLWIKPDAAMWAQASARVVGGLVSFAANRIWSFKEQEGHGITIEARRFLALYVFSYCLSLSTFYVGVRLAGLNPYWSKLFADGLCFIVNFLVMKTYVFCDAKGISAHVVGWLSRAPK